MITSPLWRLHRLFLNQRVRNFTVSVRKKGETAWTTVLSKVRYILRVILRLILEYTYINTKSYNYTKIY